MIFNLLLPFLSATYFEGVFPELSNQLCPFQKGEVVLYAISADADFRCQTVRIRKPSQLILLPILYAAESNLLLSVDCMSRGIVQDYYSSPYKTLLH